MKLTLVRTSVVSIISFFLMITFANIGCGSKLSPSETVEKFFVVVENHDAKEYDKVMTPEFVVIVKNTVEKSKKLSYESFGGLDKINSEVIQGDKATVKVTFKNNRNYDFDLVKIAGRWKVKSFGDYSNIFQIKI